MIKRVMMTTMLAASGIGTVPADELTWLDAYNVVWNSQSANAGDSMPVSGGDIGLNVWVENNELMFYLGRAGCRDENGALLKLGRVRINISPNPFTTGFKQELKLDEGYVELFGEGETNGTVKVWVETHFSMLARDSCLSLPCPRKGGQGASGWVHGVNGGGF